MTKRLTFLLVTFFSLTACNETPISHNKLIGRWELWQAFNSEGQLCTGIDDLSKGCIYNKDQEWQFKNDSLLVAKFTSINEAKFGDTKFGDPITLPGKYKIFKQGESNFLKVHYDKNTDSSFIDTLQILKLTDTTLEYSLQKHADGSGGMRFIYKKPK